MKNIAIITYYYKSINYGGVLQSYALQYYIKKLNKDNNVEQISYNYLSNNISKDIHFSIKRNIKNLIKDFINIYINRVLNIRYYKFEKFRNDITHSEIVYTDDTINLISNSYDVYVTGSDQVWNTLWYHSAFFLDFVDVPQKKVSYAASIGNTCITDTEKKIFENNLKNFKAISVREKDSIELLKAFYDKNIEFVLDPTLLMDISDWNSILPEFKNKKKYVFSYFIGDEIHVRKIAKKFAKSKGLILINLPHAAGFNISDLNFGDKKMFDAGPLDFVNLIKNAEYIFTDSFHACVFSIIYEKNFYVYPRSGKKAMGNRIYSLLKLFDCIEYFCDTDEKKNLHYLNTIDKAEIKINKTKYIDLKNISTNFIVNNIL